MNARRFLTGLVLLLVAAMCAAQRTEVKKVPIQNVSPISGEKMYVAYCAVCHGQDGKGTGPAAPAMKIPPTDLTALAKSNDGKFPARRVFNTIRGDTAMPQAHGSQDMPVWGALFWSLCAGKLDPKPETQMRISHLTDYVQSLQQK